MDRDTATSRTRYEAMLKDIENYKYDILIGTQLISKGLDFQRVTLVGVIDADELLHFPNFRNQSVASMHFNNLRVDLDEAD